MNEIIEKISLSKIRPSKTNPRKHFDDNYISSLSDSIRAKGIIQPLIARPDWCIGMTDEQISGINGNAPAAAFYEIVAGECRFRGAIKCELDEAPVIVRYLSDKETFENQLIENLQRSDLTPLEEAEGYLRLIDNYGYTVELIHEKTGKAIRTIYGKLKILKAPKILLDAMVKGLIGGAHCEIVGRIPIPEMRERAAEEILHPKFLQEDKHGGLHAMPDQPMSMRLARSHVRDNYMRSLSAAEFDQKDATIVDVINDTETGERIGGGACEDCPMRSGNRPELLGELKRPDICTNPKCFTQKTDVHFVRLQETATKEGKKLLTDEEAAKEFDESGALSLFSRYVKLAEQPAAEHVREGVKRPSWKKLLEGLESKPQIVVARDPKGRVVELVDFEMAREAVKLASKQKGEKSIFDTSVRTSTKPSSSAGASDGGREEEPAWKKQDRKNKEIAKLNFQLTLAAMGELAFRVGKLGAIKGFWEAMIEISIEHAGHEGLWLINKRLGLEKPDDSHKQMLEYGRNLKGDDAKAAFVVELLLSQQLKVYNSGSMGGVRNLDRFKVFAKLYKIDVGEIEKEIKAAGKLKENASPDVVSANSPGAGKSKLAALAKQATPKAAIVDPNERQLEDAYSAPEIMKGTIRHPVTVAGKEYTVVAIATKDGKPTEFDLVELIPAAKFEGNTRDYYGPSEKLGPKGGYHGIAIKFHGNDYVLGFRTEYRISKPNATKAPAKKSKIAKPNKSKKRAVPRKPKKKGGAK